MPNPGAMNRRLTIQERVMRKDAVGGRVQDWADAFKVWAQEVSNKQRQGEIADADRVRGDRTFRIRWNEAITAGTHRVFYQLKFYDIVGVTEEGIKDRMLIECRSVSALAP